jgi:hypothetical protein
MVLAQSLQPLQHAQATARTKMENAKKALLRHTTMKSFHPGSQPHLEGVFFPSNPPATQPQRCQPPSHENQYMYLGLRRSILYCNSCKPQVVCCVFTRGCKQPLSQFLEASHLHPILLIMHLAICGGLSGAARSCVSCAFPISCLIFPSCATPCQLPK